MSHYIQQNIIIGDQEYKIGDVVDLTDHTDLPQLIARQLVTDRPPHRKASVRGQGKTGKE